MTDQEMLQAMKGLLTPINIKLENMENRMSGMEHELSNLRLEMRRGFRKNDDEIQTLIAVLEAKGILPAQYMQF